MKLYECQVRYKHDSKTTRELYLVHALSCTEVEAKMIKELQHYKGYDINVLSIKAAKIEDVLNATSREVSDDLWYKVQVSVQYDVDKQGNPKRRNDYYMVKETDMDAAKACVKELLRGSIQPWRFASVAVTRVKDVIGLEE
jgi:hypothetical protein